MPSGVRTSCAITDDISPTTASFEARTRFCCDRSMSRTICTNASVSSPTSPGPRLPAPAAPCRACSRGRSPVSATIGRAISRLTQIAVSSVNNAISPSRARKIRAMLCTGRQRNVDRLDDQRGPAESGELRVAARTRRSDDHARVDQRRAGALADGARRACANRPARRRAASCADEDRPTRRSAGHHGRVPRRAGACRHWRDRARHRSRPNPAASAATRAAGH